MENIQANDQGIEAVNSDEVLEDESQPLVLTDRDIAIFRLVHEHRYLAFNQIRQAFWPDRSEVAKAAYRRVRRLVKAGYLEVGRSRRMSLDLYLLSEKSLLELQRRGMDLALGKYHLTQHFERFADHDLKVTNVRILFRELGIENWTSERVLKEVRHETHVPDGIVNLRGRFVAIEFDNTLKSKARYKEIFNRYANDPDYYLLIMIVYHGLRHWLVDLDYDPEQVWFVDYKDLMRNKSKILLENKHATFEFARLL